MSVIKTVKDWISTYPGYATLEDMQVDFFDPIPNNGSIAPSGMMEISRTEYIGGIVEVQNQYNFALYFVFYKPPDENEQAQTNADWVLDFQEWVQEQDIKKKVPTFGRQTISVLAQNGMLYAADGEGTGIYTVQLTINYKKEFTGI